MIQISYYTLLWLCISTLYNEKYNNIVSTIKTTTFLHTGADGVDDWDQTKWREEIDKHQVTFLVEKLLYI